MVVTYTTKYCNSKKRKTYNSLHIWLVWSFITRIIVRMLHVCDQLILDLVTQCAMAVVCTLSPTMLLTSYNSPVHYLQCLLLNMSFSAYSYCERSPKSGNSTAQNIYGKACLSPLFVQVNT